MTRIWRRTWGESGPRQSSCPDPSICCQSKPALSLRWRAKLTLTMIVKVWLTHRKYKQWYFQDSFIISESLWLSNYWYVILDFAFTPIDRSVIVLDWQRSKLYVRGEKWFILWPRQLFQTLFHCLVQNQPSPVIPWIPADVSGHQVGTIIGLTAACSVDNGIENDDGNTMNLMLPMCNLFFLLPTWSWCRPKMFERKNWWMRLDWDLYLSVSWASFFGSSFSLFLLTKIIFYVQISQVSV